VPLGENNLIHTGTTNGLIVVYLCSYHLLTIANQRQLSLIRQLGLRVAK
jgi:hypothetical protein